MGAKETKGKKKGLVAPAHYIVSVLVLFLLGSATPSHGLMGGAVQGQDLNLTISNASVTTLAGSPSVPGSTDGTGSAARFFYPYGITTDGTNLYVADNNNNTIRKIVIATAAVTTLAGSAAAHGSTDGTGSAARFYGPSDVTTDGTNLYVADSYNHTIRKIMIATGAVTTLAGSAGNFGSANGSGSGARFYYPSAITTDGTNLYVADSWNHTIRKIVIATGAVATLAGSAGVTGSADGTGTAARFSMPVGITTDGTNLYVTEEDNYTIRKIVIATTAVSTLAGSAGSFGSADGTGSTARFDWPDGITTDGANLYVNDSSNGTVRKIVIATAAVTTLAGSPGLSGSTDGTGSAARFSLPYGITTDGTSLYIIDSANSTIRRISGLYSITGAVKDFATGTGLAGATVTVKDEDGAAIGTQTTATGGVFAQNLPAAGYYSVSAALPNYDMNSPPQELYVDNTAPSAPVTVYMRQMASIISLAAGWNFVSTLRQPPDTAIARVLSGISSNLSIVWAWNASAQVWVRYRPWGSNNTLTTFESGRGYWLYMTVPAQLSVAGSVGSNTISLTEGWNLVGYNGTDNTAVSTAIQSIAGKWTTMWGWTSGTWYVHDEFIADNQIPAGLGVLSLFNQGRAYWMKIKTGQAGNWVQ
jgi:hypothetical protein